MAEPQSFTAGYVLEIMAARTLPKLNWTRVSVCVGWAWCDSRGRRERQCRGPSDSFQPFRPRDFVQSSKLVSPSRRGIVIGHCSASPPSIGCVSQAASGSLL